MARHIREKSCSKKKINCGTDGTPGVSLGIVPHYHGETLITSVLCPSGRLHSRVSLGAAHIPPATRILFSFMTLLFSHYVNIILPDTKVEPKCGSVMPWHGSKKEDEPV